MPKIGIIYFFYFFFKFFNKPVNNKKKIKKFILNIYLVKAIMLQKNLLNKFLTIRFFSSLPSVEFLNVSDRSNGVFSVELNRPAERNSFTLQLWKYIKFIKIFYNI